VFSTSFSARRRLKDSIDGIVNWSRLVQRVFLQVNPRQFIRRFILLFIWNPTARSAVDDQLRGAVGAGRVNNE